MSRLARVTVASAVLLAAACAPGRGRGGPCDPCAPRRGVSPPAAASAPAPRPDPDLERLVRWMTGEFTSAAQAAADPEYRDVRLVVARIWADRADGPWLYVEQALSAMASRPYRQRVYRVRRVGDDLFESRVYQRKGAAKAVGAATAPSPLAGSRPEDLEELPGCSVILRRLDDATFRGSTLGSACRNAFGGATYATSEVTVTADGIRSWDRGYDATSAQVWGATKGGYEFRRVAAPAPRAPAAE
jgi:hypothetical protein